MSGQPKTVVTPLTQAMPASTNPRTRAQLTTVFPTPVSVPVTNIPATGLTPSFAGIFRELAEEFRDFSGEAIDFSFFVGRHRCDPEPRLTARDGRMSDALRIISAFEERLADRHRTLIVAEHYGKNMCRAGGSRNAGF